MHPPSSFYLSHTYNVSVHTGQTDGWKSKLLIATMGNVRVCAEKKKRLSHFFPHLLLCDTLNQNILSGHLIPAFPDTTTGRMASETAGFCLKRMINMHIFFTLVTTVSACMQKRPTKLLKSVSCTLSECCSDSKTLPSSLFLRSPGRTGNWSRRWIR